MSIVIKPDASPNGETRVDAGGITFFFSKGTSQADITAEVKRTINKEMGIGYAGETGEKAQATSSI